MSENPEELPPRVADSRIATRQRSLFAGKVASRDGSMAVACTIKDLSETGARIAIARGLISPRHVYITHSRSDWVYEAEVTWTKPPQFGLKFLRSFPRDELGAELNFLKTM